MNPATQAPTSSPDVGYRSSPARGDLEVKDLNERHSNHASRVGLFLITFLMGIVCVVSLVPYIALGKALVAGSIGGILGTLSALPLIGPLLSGITSYLPVIIGIVAFGFVQFLQSWELTMAHSPTQMARIMGVDKRLNPSREANVKTRLKQEYDRHPLEAFALAQHFKLIGLVLELIVAWIFIPPVEDGNVWTLMIRLITMQWDKINWWNIGLTLLMLFALQQLYIWWSKIRHVRHYQKLQDEVSK